MKIKLKWIIIFGIIQFFGCSDEKASKVRVENEIKLRLTAIIQKKRSECLAIARDSADKMVDSLIFAQNIQVDTANRLIKPIKPLKPILKSPLDTTDVSPIFKK